MKDPVAEVWWDFEGDGRTLARGPKPAFEFQLEKIYSVCVVAQDKAGRRRLVSVDVPVGRALGRDLTMDDFEAALSGGWAASYPQMVLGNGARTPDVFFGPGCHYDTARRGVKMSATARFQPEFPRAGRYRVCLGFRPDPGQTTRLPVLIKHAKGNERMVVNQRDEPSPFTFHALGEFTFKGGAAGFLELTNSETDGRVAVDGVRWLWLGE
jgi:hypothetical protein